MPDLAYKTKLRPNNRQRGILGRHLAVARLSWNWGLEEINRWRADNVANGRPVWANQPHPVAQVKKWFIRLKNQCAAFPLCNDVCAYAYHSAFADLHTAFTNWRQSCAGKRAGRRVGYHRWRSRRTHHSARLYGTIRATRTHIRLPVIGQVRLAEAGYVATTGRIINATISERAGMWFVSVLVEPDEAPAPAPPPTGDPLGVHLGSRVWGTVSDGREYDHPRALVRGEKRLKRLARRLSRKTQGSARYRRAREQLARQHFKVAMRRNAAQHHLSADVVGRHRGPAERPRAVATERWGIQEMQAEKPFGKLLADAGAFEIVRQIGYKAARLGIEHIESEAAFPSTQTCSACGGVADPPIPLSQLTFECGSCGLRMDRETNAAANVVALTAATPGSGERDARGGCE